MKKAFCLFLCLFFALTPLLASAQTEYPICQGTVTDLALVFSETTQADLSTLSDRYEKATGGRLYVVTRHFLGGKDVRAYAASLFDAWQLNDRDILLLMVIGEETAALQAGAKARQSLPEETAATLRSAYFEAPYQARLYDEAAAQLCLEACRQVARASGKTVSGSGLFGKAAENTVEGERSWTQTLSDLFSTLVEKSAAPSETSAPVEREDKKTGVSPMKTIVVLCIIYFLFFRKRRRKRAGKA